MHATLFRVLFGGLLALSLGAASALADGGGDSSDKWKRGKLAPVYEVLEAGDFNAAIDKLSVLQRKDPDDADVLNLLGFSHRKLGDFDTALRHYQAALKLEPEHKGANEYLGELYLQTGQLAKAEERLAVLDDACFFGCKQYYDLKRSIKAYKKDHNIQ